MPKFEFKLEGVLAHRKNIERQRQRDLALLQAQMQQLQTELAGLDQSVKDATADLRNNRLIGHVDLAFLAAHRRFALAMQRKAMGLAQKMALLQRQIDQARAALAEAAKQRKAIEKLREKQFSRFVNELNRREAEALDEIGMQLSYQDLAADAAADPHAPSKPEGVS